MSHSLGANHCSRPQTAETRSDSGNTKDTPGSVHVCMFQTCGLGRTGCEYIFFELFLEEIHADLRNILHLKLLDNRGGEEVRMGWFWGGSGASCNHIMHREAAYWIPDVLNVL